MVASVRGYTDNYSFKLINFDTPRWHTLEYANWNQLDAMLSTAGVAQVRGEWLHSTAYIVGDRVFDSVTNDIFRCLVAHTSAASGTFEADRILHSDPDYWVLQLSGVPLYRGQWVPGATYAIGDIVFYEVYRYYLCTIPHISAATFSLDAANWQTVFDASAAINAAAGSASEAAASADLAADSAAASDLSAQAAAQSAIDAADSAVDASGFANDALGHANTALGHSNTASGHATAAATSATNAATSATNSATSATEAANQAAALKGTSLSSHSISMGSKTFVTQTGKQFNPGNFVTIVDTANPTVNALSGQIITYAGGSLQVNVTNTIGSGTYASWQIYISGAEGTDGIDGIDGTNGAPGITWKGNWSNVTPYVVNDGVARAGASYICIIPHTNSQPPSANWGLLAQAGSGTVVVDDQVTPAMLDADTLAKQQAFTTRINAVAKTGDTMSGNLGIGLAPLYPLHISNGTNYEYFVKPLQAELGAFGPDAPALILSSANGTKAAPTAVSNGMWLGSILWEACDGTGFPSTMSISGITDGPISSATVPTALSIWTGTNGSDNYERMRIASNGHVKFGPEVAQSWTHFEVNVPGDGFWAISSDVTGLPYVWSQAFTNEGYGIREYPCLARGTAVAPLTVQLNDELWGVSPAGLAPLGWTAIVGEIKLVVDAAPTGQEIPGAWKFCTGTGLIGGSTERMRITSDGRVGIGTIPMGNSGPYTLFHVQAAGMAGVPGDLGDFYSDGGYIQLDVMSNTRNSELCLVRGRSGVTPVQNGDILGEIVVAGCAGPGIDFPTTAIIEFVTNGAVSPGTVPTDIVFKNGSTTPIEHLRIASNGNATFTSRLDAGPGTFRNATGLALLVAGLETTPVQGVFEDCYAHFCSQNGGYGALSIGGRPASPYSAWLQSHNTAGTFVPLELNTRAGNVIIGSVGSTTTIKGGLTVDGAASLVGPITSAAPPTDGAHLANKAYVDTKVPLTGPATFTGVLTINGALVTSGSSGISVGGSLSVGNGALIVNDMTVYRAGAPTTGLMFFGNTGTKYLYYDGVSFSLSGGPTHVIAPTVGTHAVNRDFGDGRYVAKSGSGAIAGNLSVNGELTVNSAPSNNTVAIIRLGAADHYLYQDGTHTYINDPGGHLHVNGSPVYTAAYPPPTGFTSAIYGLTNHGGGQVGMNLNNVVGIGAYCFAQYVGSFVLSGGNVGGTELRSQADGTTMFPGTWKNMDAATIPNSYSALWMRVG